MPNCAVVSCKNCNYNTKGSSIRYFTFPKNDVYAKQWVTACQRRDKINIKIATICSLHFEPECFELPLKYRLLNYHPKNSRQLKADAVPTINLPEGIKHSKVPNTTRVPLDVDALIREYEELKRQTNPYTRKSAKPDVTVIKTEVQIPSDVKYDPSGSSSDVPSLQNVTCDVENNDETAEILTVEVIPNSRDIGVNTEGVSPHMQQEMLKRENELLKAENKKLKVENEVFRYEQKALHKIFSKSEIKRIKQPLVRIRWSDEDMSKALALYSTGPRTYKLLMKRGYPFPPLSTLTAWIRRIQIRPGILKSVLNIVQFCNLTNMEKICVLYLGHMKVKHSYVYDRATDEIMKPYSYVQIAILKGLYGHWKQPIFFDFDYEMTKAKLCEIIQYVESCGFQMTAVIGDFKGRNKKLYQELDINCAKPYFQNPSNQKENIYVFPEVLHLLNSMRINFMEHGFLINGQEIHTRIIKSVIDLADFSDLNITDKSLYHSIINKRSEEYGKLCTTLFSHGTYKAITDCGTMGNLPGTNWKECAEFIKLVSDWFDCFNTRVCKIANAPNNVKAYGLALSYQQGIIDKMSEVSKSVRVKNSDAVHSFQEGITMCNQSLKLLFEDVKRRFNENYILTHRLTQDVLAAFKADIKGLSSSTDSFTPVEFQNRLRSYVLRKIEGGDSEHSDIKSLSVVKDNSVNQPSTSCESGEEQAVYYTQFEHVEEIVDEVEQIDEVDTSSKVPSFDTFEGAREEEENSIGPSDNELDHFHQLDAVFNSFNGDKICISKYYINTLLENSTHIGCAIEVKKKFFTTKLYQRLEELNQVCVTTNNSRKRKRKF